MLNNFSIAVFFKNVTPRKLSLIVSLTLTASVILLLLLLSKTFQLGAPWEFFLIAAALIFGLSYFVFLNSIRYFIFRKIKLIYKSIRSFRQASKEKTRPQELSEDVLDEVEKEVSAWRLDQQVEMDNLRMLEEYRRNYVGNVAHELKTPLFNIQGYIHTLLDGAMEDESVRGPFLEKASLNLDRLSTILDDLDAINKIESGKSILDIRKFAIKELVIEVFNDLELMAEKKDITLSFKEGANKAYQVLADRENIRQVLSNLLTNSIKYGKQKGKTLVSFYDMDKYILIEISDTGIGIETQHLKHLFDRFYRVDKSRSRSEGGSGLGLSIVKHILEAHDETITVRSTPGVGTTFGFTLRKAID